MISVLIANTNFNDIKRIVDIFSTYKQFRIICITSNNNETYNKILQLKPDLVIVSLDLLSFNSYQLINEVNSKKFHIHFIVLNVSNTQIFEKLKNKRGIITCISKDIDKLPFILNKQLNSIDSASLEKNIMNELIYIGYNPSHKGTIFLLEIIKILINRNEIEDYCLKTDLYPILAKKYNKDVDLIKIDIFKATDNMYYNCESDKLYEYFRIDGKPNLKEIIYRISSNVLEKC